MRRSFLRIESTRLHWAEIAGVVRATAAGRAARSQRLLLDLEARGPRARPRSPRSHARSPRARISERPDASYELAWYAHVVARWIEAVGLEHADIVGHSLGGGIAQALLLECPARIRRLVLVSSGGLGREVALLFRLATIPLVIERWGQPFMGPCTRLALRALRNIIPAGHLDELSAINAQKGSARMFARTVRDVVGWRGQRHMFIQRAHEFAALPPMATFWGDRDAIIPATHAKALAENAGWASSDALRELRALRPPRAAGTIRPRAACLSR